jgi:quinol monooxygenase YgiN
MNTFRAVAVFPHIAPDDLEEFCSVATELMTAIQQQESTLRYDMFFNPEKTRCTVLEEFQTPEGVFEHVKRNGDLIAQLSLLGGRIEGSVFPMSQDGEALAEIRNNWDSKFHHHFIGKTL